MFHFQASGWDGTDVTCPASSNADMADHFAGRKTFYFTADGRSSAHEVLINIDIDCHGSGSLAGAIAFAEHLRDTRFPNLYYEVARMAMVYTATSLWPRATWATRGSTGRCPGQMAQGRVVPWDLGRRGRRGQGPMPRVRLGPGEVRIEDVQVRPTRQTAKGGLDQGRRASGDDRVAVDDLRRLRCRRRRSSRMTRSSPEAGGEEDVGCLGFGK